MPRGVPKAGFRNTLARRMGVSPIPAAGANPAIGYQNPLQLMGSIPQEPEIVETDDEIKARIEERFGILSSLTQDVIAGDIRALIVSGPPGLGKSYTVEGALKDADPDQDRSAIIKGFSRATGLYRSLLEHKDPNSVLVYDDCDSVFFDEPSLNLLKAACDTTEDRVIQWRAETKMSDEAGDKLETTFLFEGAIIFITNLDFEGLIASGNKIAPHLQAMMDRAFYLDLGMKTRRDYMVRIRQVCLDYGMLEMHGLNAKQQDEAMEWIDEHVIEVRELSIRTARKVAQLMKHNHNWRSIAKFTLLKQVKR